MRSRFYKDQAFGFGVAVYHRDGFASTQFWKWTWEVSW